MFPGLYVGGVGAAFLGAILALELSARGVEICVSRDEAPSTLIPSWLSFRAAGGVAKRLFSPVLRRVRFRVGEFVYGAAAAAQLPFVGDLFVSPG